MCYFEPAMVLFLLNRGILPFAFKRGFLFFFIFNDQRSPYTTFCPVKDLPFFLFYKRADTFVLFFPVVGRFGPDSTSHDRLRLTAFFFFFSPFGRYVFFPSLTRTFLHVPDQ